MNFKLTSGFAPEDPLRLEKGGVRDLLYLINYEDWTRAEVVENEKKEITSISLPNGAYAYEYKLTRGAPILTSPFNVNTGSKSGYTHSVQAFIPTKNQEIKNQFALMGNFNRVVAIVVLDASVVANVYGFEAGLSLTASEESPNDQNKGGGFDVTLSTPGDTTFETLSPQTFKVGNSRQATEQALKDLLQSSPVASAPLEIKTETKKK